MASPTRTRRARCVRAGCREARKPEAEGGGATLTTNMSVQELEAELERVRAVIRGWQDRAAELMQRAQQARADNQNAGRGLLGGLLGSKFRSAMRQGASASNAAVAREVAARRAEIANGKRQAQDLVRRIQAALKIARAEEKQFAKKVKEHRAAGATRVKRVAAKSKEIDVLRKLKAAHKDGLLTDAEYEAKRRAIVAEL